MIKDPNLGVVGSLARRRVKGLPYSTSEWQTSAPNDFRVEGALLVGAYAAFQDSSPLQFAFSHDVNKRADAAGALNNNFDIIAQPTMLAVRDKYLKDTLATSNTGELRHDAASGRFEVDTARSQGFAGVKPSAPVQLGNTTIELENPFAVLVVTSLDEAPLASAKRVLVSALGNAVNTGMSLAPGGNRLMNAGTAPTMIEPIRAKVTLSKLTGAPLEKAHLYALSPSGERTGEVPLVKDEGSLTFSIGAAQRAMHYELVRE